MSLSRELKQRAAKGRPLRIGMLDATTHVSIGGVEASTPTKPLLAQRARRRIQDQSHLSPKRREATLAACFRFRRDGDGRVPP